MSCKDWQGFPYLSILQAVLDKVTESIRATTILLKGIEEEKDKDKESQSKHPYLVLIYI